MTPLTIGEFEGPLDLLLTLIQKQKIDILDIPIVEITRQYNEIIDSWDVFDLEEASDYVLMSVRLMQIKVRSLLPKKRLQDEEDPRKELADQLILYKIFREISEEILKREENYLKRYSKDPEYLGPEHVLPKAISPRQLERAFRSLLRDQPRPVDRQILFPDRYSVSGQSDYIRTKLSEKEAVTLREIFGGEDFEELIVTFLALLELYKVGECDFEQARGDITITKKAS